MTALAIIVTTILALAGVAVVWRALSHYRFLPCPSWLVPLLENPYFEAVAGASTLLDQAGVRPGMTVLDAGCGPGRLTLPAARRVGPTGHVVALDIQPRMLERLRQRLERDGITNVDTILAGLGDGHLAANSVDVAFLVTVLGEIPDKPRALREIGAALRPGGILSVTEVLPDPHYQSVARVRALAAAAGLREQRLVSGALSFTINFERAASA